LGGALFESRALEDGKILTRAFSQYRVPRFSDAPQIDVVLLDARPPSAARRGADRRHRPGDRSAIFDATGVRLRRSPWHRTD